MSTDGQPAEDGRLAGNELPRDALDLASELKAYLGANPHDNTALEAMSDVLRVIEQVQGDSPIEWSTWTAHPEEPSPRRWLVQNWLPAGRVALFTGPGGVGKSRLVLQLAAAIASGGGDGDTWIETPDVDILRLGNGVSSDGDCVVYASWEDEPEEIYRRLADISGNPAPWATPARLDRLHLIDMAGLGPIWAPESGRHISTLAEITAAGQKVRRHCEEYGAHLLILDPLAAAYAGDENARGLVRAFISDWDSWGRKHNCAVLLVAHPPKSGANFAGSTDWQGAVRAMWTLDKTLRGPRPKQGSDDRTLSWQLALEKSNYGPAQPALHLDWDTSGNGPRWQALGPWDDTGPFIANSNGAGRNGYDNWS